MTQAYCKLCAKLHKQPVDTEVKTDIKSWWTDEACKKAKSTKHQYYNT